MKCVLRTSKIGNELDMSVVIRELDLPNLMDLSVEYKRVVFTKYPSIELDIDKYGLSEIPMFADEVSKEFPVKDYSLNLECKWDKINIGIYILDSTVNIGRELKDCCDSTVKTLLQLFGRGIMSRLKLKVNIVRSDIVTMELDNIPYNITLLDCTGDLLVDTVSSVLELEGCNMNIYSKNEIISSVDFVQYPLTKTLIVISSKDKRDAILKFRRYIMNYRVKAEDFIDLNNIYYFEQADVELFGNRDLNITLKGGSNNCYFTHIPSRSSYRLTRGEYMSNPNSPISLLPQEVEYSPIDKLDIFTGYRLPNKYDKCFILNKFILD